MMMMINNPVCNTNLYKKLYGINLENVSFHSSVFFSAIILGKKPDFLRSYSLFFGTRGHWQSLDRKWVVGGGGGQEERMCRKGAKARNWSQYGYAIPQPLHHAVPLMSHFRNWKKKKSKYTKMSSSKHGSKKRCYYITIQLLTLL